MQMEKMRMNSSGRPRDIQERTFALAVRVVRLYQYLDRKPGAGRILGQQVLRAGTSIGANLQEAQAGQSKLDFISKTAIPLKESRETCYWLRLLGAAGVLPETRLSEIKKETEELMRILGAIIVSAKTGKKQPL
jgi:four helix bundle protein